MDKMLGLSTCSEHTKFFDEPHNQRTCRDASLVARADSEDPPGDKTSLKIAARDTTFSPHRCSKEQVDTVVPLQTMTKPGVMSTQLAQRKKALDTILPNVAS